MSTYYSLDTEYKLLIGQLAEHKLLMPRYMVENLTSEWKLSHIEFPKIVSIPWSGESFAFFISQVESSWSDDLGDLIGPFPVRLQFHECWHFISSLKFPEHPITFLDLPRGYSFCWNTL